MPLYADQRPATTTGSIMIEGGKYWLNGWVKGRRKGQIPQLVGARPV